MRMPDLRKLFRRKAFATISQSPPSNAGWFPIVKEPYAGAWQRNDPLTVATLSTYSTVYACLSRISKDVGKLPFVLKELDANGLWRETTNPAYSPVLRRPNHYQTGAQFREQWILSKLQFGNTYVLKSRDARGVVVALYVLDPARVQVLVADSGDVYYQITSTRNDLVPGYSDKQVTVPATEVIHDREAAMFHPLIGIAPMAAASLAAEKNTRIQRNETAFFANGARLSGIITVPAGMSDDDANNLKDYWEKNFTGENTGRVALIGADAKYAAMTDTAANSQLVEQLQYSDEQICHAFGVPPYKAGIGQIPVGLKVDDLNNLYYSDALQARIESMEDCLDQGLGLGDRIGVELNLEPLLRMDTQKLSDVEGALVKNGIKTPNEARRRFGLAPLEGGDSCYLQQQNYSLEALARRDASDDPFNTGNSAKSADKPLTRGQANYIQKIMEGRPESEKPHARFNHETQRWEARIGNGPWNPSSWRWTPELEERWAA